MNTRLQKLWIVMLILVPGTLWAQTGGFSGAVPDTYSILNTSNATLSGTIGSFGTLTIGQSNLMTAYLDFRLRSNNPYQLTAQVGSLVNITANARSTTANAVRSITTGDIGFGIISIDKSGANVAGGGGNPIRTDTIVGSNTGPNFSSSSWPSVSNGVVSYHATLHDIDTGATQILTGDRISDSGDNSSSDNFLLVRVGVAVLPEYFASASFSGTVTFTIAHP
jgi:hypothetical protein